MAFDVVLKQFIPNRMMQVWREFIQSREITAALWSASKAEPLACIGRFMNRFAYALHDNKHH